MHVRVRIFGKPDTVVVVESMLTKIEQFRKIIKDKFGVKPKLQRLLYGGKFLENGYTFFDYNIKLNDVIQLMVKSQPDDEQETEINESKKSEEKDGGTKHTEKIEYTDAESALYALGDLVDMRDMEQGAWFEGKIVRIVYDPKTPHVPSITSEHLQNADTILSSDKENHSKVNQVVESLSPESKSKKKGIAKYFNKSPKSIKKKPDENIGNDTGKICDANLLYKIQLDTDEDDSNLYCKLKDIRPRARKEIAISDLKIGQKVMINHNTEDSLEKGYWYDFKVDEIKKLRTNYELVGTLYLGPEAVPQNDTKARIHDKIFAIEEVVPLEKRSEEYKKMMVTQPDKRALALNCLTCRDNEDTPCKDCGCYLCLGKEFPEKIVLCDECNNGYHMGCLSPPLSELPADDWYCPSCKRDPNEVVAPGAAKQAKKTNAAKTTRDWGRGMACVGKTKECVMPPNHFGPIPGIEVGMCWRFRIQLSESGVHRPPVSGIHGRDTEGAYSIVLSGGYEDDVDHGNEFTYTGSGGRDLSGNKRTAGQSCDQTLTRENRALARNCAAKHAISEQGGDAGEDWRSGKPVRVVRSYKMIKHFPKYAPKEGIRYDGIYKVVKYYPEQGLSGFRVWKYLLRRDDLSPAPWEPGAKQFDIIYPDGYLEAEAEKKALKEQNGKAKKGTKTTKKAAKKTLRERNQSSDSEDDIAKPVVRRKSTRETTKQTNNKRKSSLETTKKEPRNSNSSESETEENMSPVAKKRKSNDNDKQKKKSNQIIDSSNPSSESENDKVIKVKITIGAKKKNNRQVLNSSNPSSGSDKVVKSTKNTKSAKSVGSKRPNKSIRQYFDSSMSSPSEDTVPAKNTKKEAEEGKPTKKRKRQDGDEGTQSVEKSNEDSKPKVNGHHSESQDEISPPAKKTKIVHEKDSNMQLDDDNTSTQQHKSNDDSVKTDVDGNSEVLNGNVAIKKSDVTQEVKHQKETDPVDELAAKDTVNVKLWNECYDAQKVQGKKAFTDHVFQVFMCNICQGLVVDPVTTPCQHNFCLTCIRNALKKGKTVTCPCCRRPLADATVVNEVLREALQLIFPGYDARK